MKSNTLPCIDLHIHSYFSDGDLSPTKIVEKAAKLELKAIAITDHDNVEGIAEGIGAAKEHRIEFVPGIELSSVYREMDVHILGYHINTNHPGLLKKIILLKEARRDRAKKIVQKLNGLGLDLKFETVLEMAGHGAIGRPHIANAMVKEELVYSAKEAFDKYLGYKSSAYVDKMDLSLSEACALIRQASGIPVLAHPAAYRDLLKFIDEMITNGIQGIEAIHSLHSNEDIKYFLELGKKKGLLLTGGSDCHGHRKDNPLMGQVRVPYEFLEGLNHFRGQTRP